jgi:hypothetical protein
VKQVRLHARAIHALHRKLLQTPERTRHSA